MQVTSSSSSSSASPLAAAEAAAAEEAAAADVEEDCCCVGMVAGVMVVGRGGEMITQSSSSSSAAGGGGGGGLTFCFPARPRFLVDERDGDAALVAAAAGEAALEPVGSMSAVAALRQAPHANSHAAALAPRPLAQENARH